MAPVRVLAWLLTKIGIHASAEPKRTVSILLNGRVLEKFSDEFMHALDPDVARRITEQNITDELNDIFTPETRLGHDSEFTILGNITLDRSIARSINSVIFSIVEHPNLLIKYQAQCDDLGDAIHPLLVDAWYGQVAHDIGLAPRVVLISPGAQLCSSRRGKCRFSMSRESFQECARAQGTVRYMIVERNPGSTLYGLRKSEFASPSGALSFRNSMTIGVHLLVALERLQLEGGIIHGDIHASNVMLADKDNARSNPYYLQLIDFGMARHIANITLPEDPIYRRGHWFHPSCTDWQIDGFAWSRRDDVMKTLYLVFQLMHPDNYLDYLTRIFDHGYRSLMRWKKTERMYVTPFFDPIGHLHVSVERKQRVYELMDSLLSVARNMSINAIPPYSELISLMQEAVRVGDHRLE